MDKIEYDLACSVSTMLGKAIVDLNAIGTPPVILKLIASSQRVVDALKLGYEEHKIVVIIPESETRPAVPGYEESIPVTIPVVTPSLVTRPMIFDAPFVPPNPPTHMPVESHRTKNIPKPLPVKKAKKH